MPAYICKCKKAISYGEIPCKNEWLFISDVDYDKYMDTIEAEALYKEMNSFLKCENCGRIWIFWKGFNEEPEEFIPAERS